MEHALIAEIVLDDAIAKHLDYSIPLCWQPVLKIGMRVKVPVRTTLRQGTVVRLKHTSSCKQLLEIHTLLSDHIYLPDDLFALAQWISHYYCTPLDKVIKTMLPPSIRGKAKEKQQLFVKPLLSPKPLAALCNQFRQTFSGQALILDLLLRFPKGMFLSQLLEESKASKASVDALVKKNIIQCRKVRVDRSLFEEEFFPTQPKALNGEQQQTLHAIKQAMDARSFSVHLLHGVTGSGKTEVYLQAIDHALSLDGSIIFLVPEIALTTQMQDRLKSRFQKKIAILHSRLSLGERHDAWHRIRNKEAPIVMGARSAIFSPLPKLQLIIVDEEHEASYKQSDEFPTYHARDVAIFRGKLTQATVLLGSATPSLESYQNALQHKYTLHRLTQRADSALLPSVTIIDMKRACAKANKYTIFSDELLAAIKHRVAIGEQIILFLNRRGYHTTLLCLQCSSHLKCPRCDVKLTFHFAQNVLACHLCDYRLTPPPRVCPHCHKEGMLKFKGVGTEMVERALTSIFPEIRTLRLDLDTTRHKGSHEQLFKQFRAGKADVLIGTQMIAKGLHFPAVTLVAILQADHALQIPDFRASEFTFQLLTQVAGRSGRGALKGEVILQTYLPDHPLIALAKAQDYPAFFEQETHLRSLFHYPPFCRLVKLLFSGKQQETVYQVATEVRHKLIAQLPPSYELLPITPCGHAKINEAFRVQFLIKGKTLNPLLPLLSHIRLSSKQIRLLIDVDPMSTYF